MTNPRMNLLQAYPFEKLRKLLISTRPQDTGLPLVDLSVGEPKHPAPEAVRRAMVDALDGLSTYPPTQGDKSLREAISQWLHTRYQIPAPDANTMVLPILGSREALFAIAQVVIDNTQEKATVVCPNPFYQIYEGATLLAGAQPYYIASLPENHQLCDWRSVPEDVWKNTQLVYTCSPGNPAGSVMPLSQWRDLFELSDKYGFVIASDECYSEIYFDENNPPLGGLQAAHQLGRADFTNLLAFSSLSKRSNLPGLRSGFVAGDARLIEQFLLYRTYHGSAMSPIVSAASLAAWQDETHVLANRQAYREKFAAVVPILQEAFDVQQPDASFYLWMNVGEDDTKFVHDLLDQQAVRILAGSYVSREIDGLNPGTGFVRIALVAPLDECIEGAKRIVQFARNRRS